MNLKQCLLLHIVGIATTGVGFGGFAFAPLVAFLLDTYGWRGAFLILVAIFLNSLPLACLMRPPPKQKAYTENKEQTTNMSLGNLMGSPTLIASSVSLSGYINIKEQTEQHKDESEMKGEANVLDQDKAEQTCLDKVKQYFNATFDCSLLLNIYAVLFIFCAIFHSLPSMVAFTFLPLKCLENGISNYETASILAMMGIADICGRLIIGFIGYKMDVKILFILSLSLRGIGFIMLSFYNEYHVVMVAAILQQFAFGEYIMCNAL